ncbi:hypothetical protein BUE80_DR009849 [Diplocarpon rosae]|nr:hypothetical protein BUE80_DR009849 [Diplocarpon rosae]
MHTSVASEANPLKDLASLSNESVHISTEVSVVSSRAPTTSIPGPMNNEHGPADFTSAAVTGSGTLNRRDSRLSDTSWRHSRGPSAQSRRGFQSATVLESNRESVRALSEFLMTREPPPNHFMSIPSDDEKSAVSLKRGAIKLFGKQRKKAKAPRFMQLPDSAVAARTRSGARHIAISIPTEHDWPEGKTSSRAPNPLRSHPSQESPVETGGTVTVLKPVTEARESASHLANHARSSIRPVNSELTPSGSVSNHPPVNFGPDFNIPSAFNPDLTSSIHLGGEPSPTPRYNPQRSQNSYVTVCPIEIERQDSQRSEQRNSVGTVLSQVSYVNDGHLRGISSVSTTPNATLVPGMKLGLPPRRSSISKVPKYTHEHEGLAHASDLADEKAALEERLACSRKSGESGGTSPMSPAVFGFAARAYDASPIGPPQVVRQATPKLSLPPSPSKDLPCLPAPSNVFASRPSTVAPSRAQTMAARNKKDTPLRCAASSRDGTEESILVTRQSRQERLQSRKLRDMEGLRVLSDNRRPLSDSRGTRTNISKDPTQSQAYITAPPRSSKRGIKSSATARSLNTLSPIMLVANLPPYTGFVAASDLPLYSSPQGPATTPTPPSNAKTKPKSKSYSLRSVHKSNQTPPHSTSSDSDVPSPASALSRRPPARHSLRSPVLDTRRQERRAKRNMSLREKEMDARMDKIERDNEVLLRTLGVIAKRFEEIARAGGRVESGDRGSGREREELGSEMCKLSD